MKPAKYILSLPIIFYSVCAWSQSMLIDSLELVLKQPSINDNQRIEIYNILARDYGYISSVKSLSYAQQALQLSLLTNNKKGEAYAYRNLASYYSIKGYYGATTEFVEKAIRLFNSLEDTEGLANCYITLGHTFKRQSDYPKALEYHKLAFDIIVQSGTKDRRGIAYLNLAEAFYLNDDLILAKRNLDSAFIILSPVEHLVSLSACYRLSGIINFVSGNYKNAKNDFLEVLSISNELQEFSQKEATTEAYIYLARLAGIERNFERQREFLKEAIEMAAQNNYLRLLRIAYLDLVDFYQKRQDLSLVQFYMNQFLALNDSLRKIQDIEQATMIESVINSLRIAEENEQLFVKQQLQVETIRRQQLQIVLYTLLIVASLVLAGALFYQYHKRKLLSQTLMQEKKLIEEKTRDLEALNLTKDKFFSIVSHDLKSPLNSLQGFIKLLEKHVDGLSKEEIKTMVGNLNKDLQNTINLTHDLVLWARSQMNNDPVKPVKVPLNQVVNNVLSLYDDLVRRKQIKTEVDIDKLLCAYSDFDQITFVVRNIIHNALKFTDKEGSLRISAIQKQRTIILTFQDTGIGIPSESIRDIFVPGKIRDSRGTDGEKGTGLGLILCKEFIEKNHGKIDISSRAGEGTTIHIELESA